MFLVLRIRTTTVSKTNSLIRLIRINLFKINKLNWRYSCCCTLANGGIGMVRNYFKITIRNLLKNKAFSFINISGLAVGMASAILIILWIQNEVSMDRFHEKADRIYVLNNRDHFNGQLHAWSVTPKVLGPTVKKDYPEVEETARISSTSFLFSVGDKRITESGGFTDPGFFSIFSFPMIYGNSKTALANVNNIVITEKFARKLFGTGDVLGKTVKIDSTDYFTITGVLKDLPNNTAIRFSYLLPWSYMTKLKLDDDSWSNNSVKNYVLLKPGVSQKSFDEKIRNIAIEHTKNSGFPSTAQIFTQSIKDRWLYSKSENGQYTGGRIEMVRLFSIIAGFILLIACINFMNLSTARSEKRAKEVGIKKVVGARKGTLIFQFIGESIFISFLAALIAIILVSLSLPAFNRLINKELFIDYHDPANWIAGFSFILITGLLAGSYPAFYLSSFKPIGVLKGSFKINHHAVNPRKVLVVIQFTFAIVLIISTIIVDHQIKYAQSRDNGYNKDQVVYSSLDGDLEKNYELVRSELLRSGAAISVTKSMSPITERYSDGWGWKWEGSTEEDTKTDFIRMSTDADFVKTLGITLISGRDIDIRKYPGDSTSVLLNEAAVKVMRLKDPLGQMIEADGQQWKVVGVVKDFIYESPYEKISQLAVFGPASWFTTMHYKLNPANTTEKNLQIAAGIFRKFNPQYPFDYKFVDEAYATKFEEQQRTGTLAALFAGLTIFISCLGLFGLATYMAENRVKEIGVRKVLGASVTNITRLLSMDFLKLIIISFLIASPVAWFVMNKWLSGFTYRVQIAWWIFALAALLSIVIASLSVGYQSLKAAIRNPVESLRSE